MPSDKISDNPMQPVVSLDFPVLQVHSVKAGETAGYNATYRFKRDGYVAILAAGYADGVFRNLSDVGSVYWKEYKLPLRGRVSMDLVMCDLSHVREQDMPSAGDYVEMIGENQTIDDLAQQAGTISYEILTSLGHRYNR